MLRSPKRGLEEFQVSSDNGHAQDCSGNTVGAAAGSAVHVGGTAGTETGGKRRGTLQGLGSGDAIYRKDLSEARSDGERRK